MAPKSHYPILKLDHFNNMEGVLIVDIAAELKRPYEVVKGAIHRLGIRERFPQHGGRATWIAKRGYINNSL